MSEIQSLILEATGETVYMIVLSTFFTLLVGLPLSLILFSTSKNGLGKNSKLYTVLDFIVNILRSFPFIILIILLLPLSKIIVGTRLGTTAAIVPLTIGAIPFLARLFEQAYLTVDKGIIEACKSMGASDFNILTRVIISESLPQLIASVTNLIITLIGYSAMAGVVGGGGLGSVAKRFGYDRINNEVLFLSVIVIIALVQIIQFTGTRLAKKVDKRK